MAHSEPEAEDAWQRITSFFAEHLADTECEPDTTSQT
jgi:hypothetical protein